MTLETDRPPRALPRLSPDNEFFWKSGADGKLRFLRCDHDGYYVHPPAPICPRCLRKDLTPTAVSGRGTVATFTVNYQRWLPGWPDRYVIALVEIEEQPSVRLMTNLVHCDPEAVAIGMPVRVVFEPHEDVWIPVFEPRSA
jgi:uncharacterized OB-fold protein